MPPCVDTYKLTNDVGRTSKGKNQIIKFSTKVDNVQRDKKYSSQINLKALFKCEVTASSSRKAYQTTWHHFMPTAARERIKGSADYSALIQKARWLETRTQHLILK